MVRCEDGKHRLNGEVIGARLLKVYGISKNTAEM